MRILYREDDFKQLEQNKGKKIRTKAENKIETKNKQIEDRLSMNRVSRRFHKVFGVRGLHVIEMSFTVNSAGYRVIALKPSGVRKYCIVLSVVAKSGNEQEKVLKKVRREPETFKEDAREKIREVLEEEGTI